MTGEDNFACSICNARLMHTCYRRSRSFRLFRGALIVVMRYFARWHSIDSLLDQAPAVDCRDCVRHMKARLKQRSLAFRWLNRCMNPVFHAFRDRLVTPAELAEARQFAESCRRNISGRPIQLEEKE